LYKDGFWCRTDVEDDFGAPMKWREVWRTLVNRQGGLYFLVTNWSW